MGITDEANERAWGGVVKASGSDLFSNALCEGRFLADQSFPDEQFDNFADTGSRLHEMMELGTPLDEIEDDNERYAVERARQMESRMIEEFSLNGEVHREPRLWCRDGEEGIFSGCVDRLEVGDSVGSIIDYKMLYGVYEAANRNKQLQVYAVLVFDNYPQLQELLLGLIQPMLNKATTARISRAQAEKLKQTLVNLSRRISIEGAKLEPGAEQCKYCSALPHCPEAYEYIKKIPKLNEEDDMEAVNNEKLAEKMGDLPLLERFAKSVKGLVRSRLEKDVDVPGFQLRSSGKITTFNAKKAGEILFDANFGVDEFLKCCTLKEPQLVAAWALKTGLSKPEARKDLRLRLENCMTQKPKAKSVTKS
jgi:hypothetical protein|tara:strand:- start:7844 stop:8938 length:1095 start_codon:yes stop_codon:yes gene_type:complete